MFLTDTGCSWWVSKSCAIIGVGPGPGRRKRARLPASGFNSWSRAESGLAGPSGHFKPSVDLWGRRNTSSGPKLLTTPGTRNGSRAEI